VENFPVLLIRITAICLCAFFAFRPQTGAQPGALVILHITVIDATGQPPQADLGVLIRDGKIERIAKADRLEIPKNAQILDGTGKYLIPGLWDSHVHLTMATDQEGTRELLAPLLVAYGVTTVREMGGDWKRIVELRREIADGKVIGPRIFAPGPFVDGPQPASVNVLSVSNETEARTAVRKLKNDDVDFIKVQSGLSPEAYRAVLDEARKLAVPVAGHIPEAVSAFEVARSGQRSVEHSSPVLPGDAGVMLACTGKENEIRAELASITRLAGEKNADRQRLLARQRALQRTMAETRDQKTCAELFRLFVKGNVRVVPTQIWAKRFAPLDAADLGDQEVLRFAPQTLRTRWITRRKEIINASAEDNYALRRLLFEKSRELVGAMHRSRVTLLAGTDSIDGFTLPGPSLHDELALMVEAGLSPMEALQTATRNPAEFLDRSNRLGRIVKDGVADLVILDANPLQNIANTRKIHAIIIGGKLISQTQRQEMLARLEAFAQQH
jgi:imidazolonepropionase-like amidohydrolase